MIHKTSNRAICGRSRTSISNAARNILILLVLVMGCVLAMPIPGRRAETVSPPVPMVHDWSQRFTVYPRFGSMRAMMAVEQDPRAWFLWRRRGWLGGGVFGVRERSKDRFGMHRDWSINLGKGGTAQEMYPAKFSFDVTAAPSCLNDYVVFPVNAAGSATQPNIVAFDNLYSGTAPGATGICNRTPTANDNGTAATVTWSYNVQGISGGGAVPTSPAISYDIANPSGPNTGNKVAFVESAAGSAAHFHVLAWKSGNGVAANLQNTLLPLTINSFVAVQPVSGSGTATDLMLGSSTTGADTMSSPFVDYSRDVAYVGNDIGTLYRIKNVFCTSINPNCSGASKPAPSLDGTWGTGGAISVCNGTLTGPVLDFVTLNVFVGCSDGKLYSVSQSGTIKSIVVGDGVASKTYGGIVDPPLVDGVDGFVYAVSGSASGGANGVLVQATTSFSSSVAVPIGAGNQCNLHLPTFNNAYFTNITSAGALIYVGGVTGVVGQPCSPSSTTTGVITIYGVGFGAGGVMKSGAPANSFSAGGGPGAEWAPLLSFYNATTSIDWLFVAALQSGQTNIGEANITAGFPGGVSSTLATEGLGPSAMIVDNDSASAQAASIYFNALGENAACTNNTVVTDTGGCAVKLTQSGLQ